MAKRKSLADQLRAAVTESGLSARKLAVLTGVSQPALSNFLGGKGKGLDVKTGTAEAIAAALGMQIQLVAKGGAR